MASTTAAGTAIAISAGSPAGQSAAAYGALSYTDIGNVESIGGFGAATEMVGFQPLKGPMQKYKGPTNYGTLNPTIAVDEADAGQALLSVAAQPSNSALYAIRVTKPDGSLRYFQVRVFGMPETIGAANTMITAAPVLEINTAIVKVLSNGTSGPALTVAFLGSSTPSYYFSQFTGTANARVSRSTDGKTFTAYGTVGQGGATFGNLTATGANRDTRLLGLAKSGSTLSEWEADGSVVRAAAVAAIKAANADAVVPIVGFNDARTDKSVTSQAAHAALYRSFLSKLRAEVGRPIRAFIGTTQKYNDGDPAVLQQMAWVRAAELEVASDPNNSLYAHAYDLQQLPDGVHMADGQYVIHATRGSKAVLAWVNGTAYDPADAGPTPPLTYTPPTAPNGTARINHSAPTNSAVSGYNNWAIPADVSGTPSANAGASIALVDTAGVATGWTATIVAPFVGAGAATGATTGNDSGAAPDQVLVSNWFVGDAASPNARRDPATVRYSGFDPAALYTFRFLGSRSGTTGRETTYTVEGVNTKSGTHVNNGNTATTTTLTDMQPNADGTLLITVKAAGTATFGYLTETRIAKQ